MKLFQKIFKNDGFTLIEAIVSVVIVGIAIVPISVVYTRTIEKTVDTRIVLEASELGTKYMEAVKDKPFKDFNDIFHNGADVDLDSGSVEFVHGSDLSVIDLDPVPEGYKIKVEYDHTALADSAYEMPTEVDPADVDAVVEIPSGNYQQIDYKWGDGSDYTDAGEDTSPEEGATPKTRDIKVTASRSDGSITIEHYDDSSTLVNKFKITSPSEYAIRFVIGDEGTSNEIETTVTVVSDMTDELRLYFYENDGNYVQPLVNVQSGLVSTSRNLYLIDSNEPRVSQIQVDVIKTSNNETLFTMTSSKVNE